MKHLTKWLAVLLCVSLAACGAVNTESDTAGSDWRTTGIVRDSGELTQNGETQTVLLCVHENDAVLYKDSEEQTAVCSVEYPMAVPDSWDAYQSVDFSDRDGDGNSDICLTFLLGDGDTMIMVWLWDGESYVFSADESSVLGQSEK